jgi:phage portal protein BeeE
MNRNKFEVPAERMIAFAYPSALSPFDALGPTQAGAGGINLDHELLTAQTVQATEGIRPTLAIIVGGGESGVAGVDGRPTLTREQHQQIVTAIRGRYAGVSRANEPLILDALIRDVKPLFQQSAESPYVASSALSKSRVMETYGTSAAITGALENSNRAAAQVSIEHFYKFTVAPIIKLMNDTMTAWLAPLFGDDLVVRIPQPEAQDADLVKAYWSLALQYGAVDRNELRTHALKLEPRPEFAAVLEPAGYLPAGQDSAQQANGFTPAKRFAFSTNGKH